MPLASSPLNILVSGGGCSARPLLVSFLLLLQASPFGIFGGGGGAAAVHVRQVERQLRPVDTSLSVPLLVPPGPPALTQVLEAKALRQKGSSRAPDFVPPVAPLVPPGPPATVAASGEPPVPPAKPAPDLAPKEGRHQRHRVEHAEILNNKGLWWVMGAVMVLVGIAVVKVQVQQEQQVPVAKLASAKAEGKSGDEGQGQHEGHGEEAKEQGDAALQYYFHLFFCAGALTTSMLLWGVAQEYIMTVDYAAPGEKEELIPDPLFVVLCNRLMCIAVVSTILCLSDKPLYSSGFLLWGPPAVTNTLASWFQYSSLDYISFTFQTTAKSAKLVPVLMISSIRGKRHGLLDYAEALVIVTALSVFCIESDGKNQSSDMTSTGVLLVVGLLLSDSVTPHLQDAVFKRHPETGTLQATLTMASFAAVMVLVAQVAHGSLLSSLHFVGRNPEAILHLLVVSLSSTLTQLLISCTVKHFGPVIFTLIASTRQVFSVLVSAVLFQHHISGTAGVALVVLFGTVIVRGLRPALGAPRGQAAALRDAPSQAHNPTLAWISPWLDAGVFRKGPTLGKLILCGSAIQILYCFYTVTQEFLATHTFRGEVFRFPLFLIAVNHSFGALFAFAALQVHGMPAVARELRLTLLPASSNLVSTYLQHRSLYYLIFPLQTLMKTMRVLPVMLLGLVLKNRTYSSMDYIEGVLITGLISYFLSDSQMHLAEVPVGGSFDPEGSLWVGVMLMMVYVVVSSFTDNLEDCVYQRTNMDPGQMLFGMELSTALVSWLIALVGGELIGAAHFIDEHPSALSYILIMALTSACGAYSCTLTVRLFGPAIFTLLMTARQIFSLVISAAIFQSMTEFSNVLCLVAVAILILASSIRQFGARHATQRTCDPA